MGILELNFRRRAHAMTHLLLFSHDRNLQSRLASALGDDYSVAFESDASSLRSVLYSREIDVLLLDIDPGHIAQETYIALLTDSFASRAAIVVMTDDSGRAIGIELMHMGAHCCCRKPPSMRELKAILCRAHEYSRMKRRLEGKKSAPPVSGLAPACDGLIGSSGPIRAVYDLIRRVSPLAASVLISGESGTGKELIARAIHNLSPRRNQPFVAVSCGAIPESLIESELFGSEKGSYTGSIATRNGYFEQAGGGTLFLDEIGELSLQTQVKLLRVLQQKEFCRIGGNRIIPLKARIVFATHRDLARMTEEGKFRLDLFYRINVLGIRSPSLAERPEDISTLTHHFIGQYSELYEKRVTGVSSAVLAALQEYDWPGNVRELENVIQSAIVRADADEIQLQDLPDRFPQDIVPGTEDCPNTGTFEKLIHSYKVRLALKAIEECKGNKTMAARSLDISRAYLHRLIRTDDVQSLHVA
jgi:DNA-binding NtrC family response regulator